jgi:hypothetical protein
VYRDATGEHVHVFDELTIENGNVQTMVQRIIERYGKYLHLLEVTGDAMGNNRAMNQPDFASIYELIIRGLKISKTALKVPSNPRHSNSRADVNFVLFKFPDFKVNPNTCPNLCLDMRMVQCDAFGEIIKKNRKDLSQRADHLDCLRYLVNTFLFKWIATNRKF